MTALLRSFEGPLWWHCGGVCSCAITVTGSFTAGDARNLEEFIRYRVLVCKTAAPFLSDSLEATPIP